MSQQNLFASNSISEGQSAPTYETVAKLNKEKLENLVSIKIHPHPVLVIFGVFIVMALVYIFWVSLLQSTPEGIWLNEISKQKHKIVYSRVYGAVTIMVDDKIIDQGTLKGSVLTIGNGDKQRIGVWDTNKIYWINPSNEYSIWIRELTLI
jgi:hypothetical protein